MEMFSEKQTNTRGITDFYFILIPNLSQAGYVFNSKPESQTNIKEVLKHGRSHTENF